MKALAIFHEYLDSAMNPPSAAEIRTTMNLIRYELSFGSISWDGWAPPPRGSAAQHTNGACLGMNAAAVQQHISTISGLLQTICIVLHGYGQEQ